MVSGGDVGEGNEAKMKNKKAKNGLKFGKKIDEKHK
jgi:hypothetical protein